MSPAVSWPGVPRPRPDRAGPVGAGAGSRDGPTDGPLPLLADAAKDAYRRRLRGPSRPGDAPLPLLDDAAKAAYRRRLGDLRAELAEPSAAMTSGGRSRTHEEIEALTQRLAAAMGLRGRDRPAGSAAE